MQNESLEHRALVYAIKAHQNVLRKDKITPYILHPVACAEHLKDLLFRSEVIAAGYLHDVVEDTSCTIEDIENIFGLDVALLVNAVTEQDKSLSWEERKKRYLHHLETEASAEAIALAFVDKIDNMASLRKKVMFEDVPFFEANGKFPGDKCFLQSFNAPPDRILWYHQEVLKVGIKGMFKEKNTSRTHTKVVRLVASYRIELEKFENMFETVAAINMKG